MEQQETTPEVQEEAKEEKVHDPADLAATFFGLYQLKLSQYIGRLNAKQLKRAFFHAIVYPLEGEDYKPKTEDEKNAFLIAQRLIEAKLVMIQAVELEKIRQAQNEELNQPDSSTDNNEQVENGDVVNG